MALIAFDTKQTGRAALHLKSHLRSHNPLCSHRLFEYSEKLSRQSYTIPGICTLNLVAQQHFHGRRQTVFFGEAYSKVSGRRDDSYTLQSVLGTRPQGIH